MADNTKNGKNNAIKFKGNKRTVQKCPILTFLSGTSNIATFSRRDRRKNKDKIGLFRRA